MTAAGSGAMPPVGGSGRSRKNAHRRGQGGLTASRKRCKLAAHGLDHRRLEFAMTLHGTQAVAPPPADRRQLVVVI